MKVLHIGHSKGWRGGENQVSLLVQGMAAAHPDIDHFLAYPCGAAIFSSLTSSIKSSLMFKKEKIVSFNSLLQLVRFSREHDIDVLHAHTARAHTLACVAKSFLPEIKIVVHRRVDMPIKQAYFTRKKYLGPKVDAFISISEKISQALIQYGIEDNLIDCIKSGISIPEYGFSNKFQAKQALTTEIGLPIERQNFPLIGFVSAMDPKKNPLLYIEMLSKLHKKGVQFNAVIAGSGELTEAVSEAITRLGLTEHVFALGFVENTADLFQALDIFVLPSLSEGLGSVLLEAGLAECAIVASNVGGISEIVSNGQTGYLIDLIEPENFCDSVELLISNPDESQIISKNAQIFVEKNFNMQDVVERTAQLYRRL